MAAPPAVVATGGGILTSAANRELIRRSGLNVWLDADFATVAGRVSNGAGGERPLFRDTRGAAELYQRRRPLYRRQADLRVVIGPAESPAAIVRRILERMEAGACAT